MTKFEEEFKALSSWDWVNVDLIQQILTRFGNWHSDEEFQAKEKEIKRLRKINHLYKKAKGNAERLAVDRGERLNQAQDEITFLESQLQQQTLPAVPELTQKQADTLNDYKNGPGSLVNYLSTEIKKGDYEYFARAWIDGHTVKKPQLFEVKMPIVYWDDYASQLTNGFEFLRIDKETDEMDFVRFLSNTKKHTGHFTEQEIKSINERYWQFAVPVEDGE